MLWMDHSLAQRLERVAAQRQIAYPRGLRALQPSSGAAWLEIEGSGVAAMGTRFPVNRAVGLGMQGAVAAATLNAIEAFYQRAELPAEIDLCPHAHPSLLEQLAARGYGVLRFFNIFVRNLEGLPLAPRLPTGLSIHESSEEEAWVEAMTDGDPHADEAVHLLARVALLHPTVRCLLAYQGQQLIGGAALSLDEGVATLFSAVTHPPYRRQGVQGALLHARLLMAREAGCELATVMTVPGSASQRNILRAGFQLAYSKVVMKQRTNP